MDNIEKIKLEVINNKLKYNELLELYIKYLKIKQKTLTKIPSYRSDYKYYLNSRNTNCYAYAFRLDLPDYFNTAFKYFDTYGFYFEPGCFSNIYDINTESKLLEALYSDLDILNINYSKEINNNHQYKVAVFQEQIISHDKNIVPDFHFSRLNSNNMWSSKNGLAGKIEKTNSEAASFGYKLIKTLNIHKID